MVVRLVHIGGIIKTITFFFIKQRQNIAEWETSFSHANLMNLSLTNLRFKIKLTFFLIKFKGCYFKISHKLHY